MKRGGQAVLVMDVQDQILDNFIPSRSAYLDRLVPFLDKVRSRGVRIVFVQVSFRADYPEINGRNRMFSAVRSAGLLVNDRLAPELERREDEPLIVKKRVGAFHGTELATLLGGLNVTDLALAGIATSGVVLSTLRAAADLDFAVCVIRDCCDDADPDIHYLLMDKVFPAQASVLTGEQYLLA